MRSKASLFKGHPIHPMLIPFPLAAYFGTLLFDVLGVTLNDRGYWATGGHLRVVGVLTALAAAVPGFIDYLYTVPPRSSGKRHATQHMIVTLSATALFILAFLVRGDAAEPPGAIVLALEALGVALITYGGWIGGTLAFRNQIGVDHRYAGAGKWKEESIEARVGAPVRVARSDEPEVNQMKLLRVGDRRIVLGRTEAGFVAFDDRCTHRGGSLAGGALMCGQVQCPWHGSQFDVTTGGVERGPAREKIGTYRIEESGGEVRLIL